MTARDYPPAGRALDRLVAERLMGMEIVEEDGAWIVRSHGERISARCKSEKAAIEYIPRYSTNMGAAWRVVEALQTRGSSVKVAVLPIGDVWVRVGNDVPVCYATPAHAICIAALRVYGTETAAADQAVTP